MYKYINSWLNTLICDKLECNTCNSVAFQNKYNIQIEIYLIISAEENVSREPGMQ